MSQTKQTGEVNRQVHGYLKELHLPTVRQHFEEQARRAEKETLSYEEYLLGLTRAECEVRQAGLRLLQRKRLAATSRAVRGTDTPGPAPRLPTRPSISRWRRGESKPCLAASDRPPHHGMADLRARGGTVMPNSRRQDCN